MLLTDSTATIPKMKAVHTTVVAGQGSNVILQCRGSKVTPIDIEVQWKFNGQIIKEDTNKKVTEKYLHPHEKRIGLFSLHITNVSVKDVGKYACKASVSDYQKANVDEDFIELSLYNKGEFHLLVLVNFIQSSFDLQLSQSSKLLLNELKIPTKMSCLQ